MPRSSILYRAELSRKLRKTTVGFTNSSSRRFDGLPPLGSLSPSNSDSARKGPDVPRLRFRPVLLGTVTLSKRFRVWTIFDVIDLAMTSSGRRETPMVFDLSFDPRNCGEHEKQDIGGF